MFWNRVAVLKLIQICRAIWAQAYRGRNCVKLSRELFESFSAALEKVTGDEPTGARHSAELIVRDFKAATTRGEIDDEAWAALTDWITDGIYFAVLDLSAIADDLRLTAPRVLDEGGRGDLRGTLAVLQTVIERATGDGGGGEA